VGARGETGYNSNVFGGEDAEGDGNFEAGPTLELRQRRGELQWNLRYEPYYQVFYTLDDINAWFHEAEAEVLWRPTAGFEVFLADAFIRKPVRASTLLTDTFDPLVQASAVFENRFFNRNFAEGGVRYSFTPRWLGEINLSNSLLDYDDPRFFDSTSTRIQAFVRHAWSRRLDVGLGLSGTRQRFTRTGSPDGGSDFVQVFGLFDYDISPTWRIRANAGPTLVMPLATDTPSALAAPSVAVDGNGELVGPADFASCEPFGPFAFLTFQLSPEFLALCNATTGLAPTIGTVGVPFVGQPPEQAGDSLTYFANIAIEKEWSQLLGRLSYVRSASNTSGLGQSLITDVFAANFTWRPSDVWTVNLAAVFTQRESASDNSSFFAVGIPAFSQDGFLILSNVAAVGFEQSQSQTFQNYGLRATASRRIGRHTRVFANVAFQRIETDFETQNPVTGETTSRDRGFNRFVVGIGVSYEFSPIHLPILN